MYIRNAYIVFVMVKTKYIATQKCKYSVKLWFRKYVNGKTT